jgi:hypothetical protein
MPITPERLAERQTMISLAKCALMGLMTGLVLLPPGVDASPLTAHPDVRMSPGLYRCDLDRQVRVRHVSRDQRSAVLTWNKRDYPLQAVPTTSGAMRFEDQISGLAWISIVEKSLLLDTRTGKQLANDCRK